MSEDPLNDRRASIGAMNCIRPAQRGANFGIQGLTQSLAMEVARHGVTVNAVCPGAIDTARMDVLGRGDGWQRQLDRIPSGCPMRGDHPTGGV